MGPDVFRALAETVWVSAFHLDPKTVFEPWLQLHYAEYRLRPLRLIRESEKVREGSARLLLSQSVLWCFMATNKKTEASHLQLKLTFDRMAPAPTSGTLRHVIHLTLESC